MFLHRFGPLALLAMVFACAPITTTSPSPSPQGAPVCRVLDTSTPFDIHIKTFDDLRVHSLVAPEISSGTATHILETPESLIVVDTQMLRDYARAFRAYADKLDKPISHVIVSHAHPDHYFGLEYFEDLPTFALAPTLVQMKQRGNFHLRNHRENEGECDAVTDRVRMPAATLEPGPKTIGGIEFLFEHLKRGEDNDQLVIAAPAHGVLVLQDLMATDTHGYVGGGMVDGWVAHLERYSQDSRYTYILAGHGVPTDASGLTTMIDYVQDGAQLLNSTESGPAFIEAMHKRFPDKHGDYLLELMATLSFPKK